MIWIILIIAFIAFLGHIDSKARQQMELEQKNYIYDKDGNLREGQQHYTDKAAK